MILWQLMSVTGLAERFELAEREVVLVRTEYTRQRQCEHLQLSFSEEMRSLFEDLGPEYPGSWLWHMLVFIKYKINICSLEVLQRFFGMTRGLYRIAEAPI